MRNYLLSSGGGLYTSIIVRLVVGLTGRNAVNGYPVERKRAMKRQKPVMKAQEPTEEVSPLWQKIRAEFGFSDGQMPQSLKTSILKEDIKIPPQFSYCKSAKCG